MRSAVLNLSISTVRADALFASALQRSDEPSVGQVRQAVGALGDVGCAARVAQAYGEQRGFKRSAGLAGEPRHPTNHHAMRVDLDTQLIDRVPLIIPSFGKPDSSATENALRPSRIEDWTGALRLH